METKNLIRVNDLDDIKFIVTLSTELILAGMDILNSLNDKRDYKISELIEISNKSTEAREEARKRAHEYIKIQLGKLET